MSPELGDLRGVDLFKGLGDSAIGELRRSARTRQLRRGSLIFGERGPAEAVHVLTSGFGKLVQTTSGGAHVILRYVGPFATFGASGLVADRAYHADAVAVTHCSELHWPVGVIRDLLALYPAMALNRLRVVEERLRGTEVRLRELSTAPVEKRIAQALTLLLRDLGQCVGNDVEIPFPFTRQDVAEMTGTTLHTVSRTFGYWEHRGLIERGRLRVRVADLSALAAIAEERLSDAAPRRTHRRRGRPAVLSSPSRGGGGGGAAW
jgi:CRP/FNR family transcriptional regulator, nitrogen oxide reductase regulator